MSKKQDRQIKIFVSHRIDLDSDTINNPLYVDVRCGAALDNRKNINILGDNIGDNISDRKGRYSEFTVQYWAWKNIDAEYYGLCHYRRYLSFTDKYYDFNEPHMFAVERFINKSTLKKYSLLNYRKMKKEIKKYDVITSFDYPVNTLPFYPKPRTEYELWNNHPHYLIGEKEIKLLLEIIRNKFPIYYDTALELMELDVHKGFNCFIMKKDLFFQMCEFEFGVLFEVEKQLDYDIYAGNSERTLGYLGEILYGTFMLWLKKQNIYKIKETQIILFTDTQKNKWRYIMAIKEKLKDIMSKVWPSYKVALRLEQQLQNMQGDINRIKRDMNVMQTREQMKFWLGEPVFHDNLDNIKKRFWESFPKAEGDLRLIQQGNVVLLERLKKLCDKLGVTFWMHGGSLVGAVRHHGFVPWDDDIDIAIMRDDFEKVKQYIEKSEHYEIAEYYYTNLGCRSYRFRRKDLISNFFVDIFLYDNYKNEYEDIIDDWKKIRLFKQGIINQWKSHLNEEGIDIFNDTRLDDKPELKLYIDKIVDRYIDKFRDRNKEDYILWGIDNNYENATRFAWHNGRIFKYEDIFPLKECEYEGKIYNIPANYEKYIFAEYGIGYLEMPNNIGVSVHVKQYFEGVDIKKVYQELIDTEKKINDL